MWVVNVYEGTTNGCSIGEMWKPIIEKFYYDDFVGAIQCKNDLSSVPPVAVMQSARKLDEDKFYDFVRKDCHEKIKDVKETNQSSGSVSAFMSIPAMIGFFAKLFYHKNASFHNATRSTERGDDCKSYVRFVNKFLLNEADANKYDRRDGLAFVLYKMVRCGLLHGESVDNAEVSNVRVELSHRKGLNSLSELDHVLSGRTATVSIVLNAIEICDELETKIDEAFNNADIDERNSIMSIYELDPPIIFLKKGENNEQ